MRERRQVLSKTPISPPWAHWRPIWREMLEFFCFSVGLYLFSRQLLALYLQGRGLGAEAQALILADNEMLFQGGALVLALYAQDRRKGRPFWSRLAPLPRSHWPLYLESSLSHSLRGALWACVPVSLSIVLGFTRLEHGAWNSAAVFQLAPAFLLQVSMLFLWIVALESLRRYLRQSFAHDQALDEKAGQRARAFAILFEATLLYRVLCASPLLEERLYFVLIALSMAAGMQLWAEWHERRWDETRGALAPLTRLFFQWGFLLALYNIFGYPLAAQRGISLWNVFDGPLGEPAPGLARQAPAGAFLFGVLLVLANNALLLRWLRREPRARSHAQVGDVLFDTPVEHRSLVDNVATR